MQCGFADGRALQTAFGGVQLGAEGGRGVCAVHWLNVTRRSGVTEGEPAGGSLTLCSRPQQLGVARTSPAPGPVKFSPHCDERAPQCESAKDGPCSGPGSTARWLPPPAPLTAGSGDDLDGDVCPV